MITPENSLTLASAFLLGLLHSLEPSHAKAVLASYFLNRKRTWIEAVAFAVTVTLAHTLVIYLLAGLGYAFGWSMIHDEHQREVVEHWSEMIGGVVMIIIGIWMFLSEKKSGFHKNEGTCCHGHNHAHEQGHFFHHHPDHHVHENPSSLKEVFALGFCSGAIPCMSGLVVLTTAWTHTSPTHGFLLLAAFSGGLGVIVLAMCLAMQQAPRLMDRYWESSRKWVRFLPILSSGIIILMGLAILVLGLFEGGAHHH